MSWKCGTCGEVHESAPDSYGYDWPWHWSAEMEGKEGCFHNSDYCVIDDTDYFIRGVIKIPILERDEPFLWGVWTTLSKKNFDRERELVNDPKREEEPPYFGWLSSRIDLYPDTLLLKTHVHTGKVGQRPTIELEPSDHPLAVEQHKGIHKKRLHQIGEQIAHGWQHPEWKSGKNVPE